MVSVGEKAEILDSLIVESLKKQQQRKYICKRRARFFQNICYLSKNLVSHNKVPLLERTGCFANWQCTIGNLERTPLGKVHKDKLKLFELEKERKGSPGFFM